MKESSIGLGYVDCTDYEPYADKFNDMYNKYLTDRSFEDVSRYSLQNIAYEIVPVVFHKQCYSNAKTVQIDIEKEFNQMIEDYNQSPKNTSINPFDIK